MLSAGKFLSTGTLWRSSILSREAIARDFAGVPEARVHKIVVGNAARLYGLS